MNHRNILITGITGQDGLFLSEKILSENKEHRIYGTTRGKQSKEFLSNLNVISKDINFSNISLVSIDLKNKIEVEKLISDIKPYMIFHLSGPSSVYESYEDPITTKETIKSIFNNITESCINQKILPSFFNASSSETFSNDNFKPLNEKSKFNPRSPYAEAKYELYRKTEELRNLYGWKIKSGIMFNHESQFRGENYLIMKIINQAIKIRSGNSNKLEIGSLSYIRDWSYAGDIADAIYRINTSNLAEDYVIGSGVGNTIKNLVEIIFSYFELDYKEFIVINKSLLRNGDPISIVSDPSKISNELNWKTQIDFENLIDICIKFKLSESY